MSTVQSNEIVWAADRPHKSLLTYYFIVSLVLGPFFPLILIPLFLRFRTLHYSFDSEGVSMRWGMLFHREISLTYTRIQDIHLASNAVERYLGLARVQVQTASGAAKAEMTIDGLLEYEEIRDFLYSRMRGVRSERAETRGLESESADAPREQLSDSLTTTLSAVASEVAGLRKDLAHRTTAAARIEQGDDR
jgi:membrane protein YdbS with pleckstrin-like domain